MASGALGEREGSSTKMVDNEEVEDDEEAKKGFEGATIASRSVRFPPTRTQLNSFSFVVAFFVA